MSSPGLRYRHQGSLDKPVPGSGGGYPWSRLHRALVALLRSRMCLSWRRKSCRQSLSCCWRGWGPQVNYGSRSMAVRWVLVCPSSPWSPGNCFCQWRSKVWTADPTARTSHCRDKKKKKTKKNVSETDIKYFFQMFSSSSDKRKYHHSLWEFFMGIRHCSLTFQWLLIESQSNI